MIVTHHLPFWRKLMERMLQMMAASLAERINCDQKNEHLVSISVISISGLAFSVGL